MHIVVDGWYISIADIQLRETQRKTSLHKKTSTISACFGGQRWIRTIVDRVGRFTVCSLWPLGNLPINNIGAGDRNRTNNLLITNQKSKTLHAPKIKENRVFDITFDITF